MDVNYRHRYKAIATVSFAFDSDDSHAAALEHARAKLAEILDENPYGEDFGSFAVQLSLIRLKDKHKLTTIAEFPIEDVLPFITKEDSRKTYTAEGKEYQVRMNSDRYFVFLTSLKCVSCGLEGTKMMLELNPGDNAPHFNLYAVENSRLVLMTKDHIIAKSQGGLNELQNYETCCAICNNLKAHYNLSYEETLILRRLYDNPKKLPKNELKELVERTRKKMLDNKADKTI